MDGYYSNRPTTGDIANENAKDAQTANKFLEVRVIQLEKLVLALQQELTTLKQRHFLF